MKRFLKRVLGRTPFASLTRRVWCQLHGSREPWVHSTEDNARAVRVMQRLLHKRSNCVDVGSNYGDALFQMIRFAPWGRHFAFEPIPELAARLRARFPGFEIFDTALSDTAGPAVFHHVVDDSGYSGLKRRSYPREDFDVQAIRVETARLDDVLPQDVPIDLVKVDVEGAELHVFRGALQTLKRCRPVILFEHGLGAADYYGTTPEEIYELLCTECSLYISTLTGWLDGGEPLARDTFVALFHQGHHNFLAHP